MLSAGSPDTVNSSTKSDSRSPGSEFNCRFMNLVAIFTSKRPTLFTWPTYGNHVARAAARPQTRDASASSAGVYMYVRLYTYIILLYVHSVHTYTYPCMQNVCICVKSAIARTTKSTSNAFCDMAKDILPIQITRFVDDVMRRQLQPKVPEALEYVEESRCQWKHLNQCGQKGGMHCSSLANTPTLSMTAEHGVISHYPENGNGVSLRNVGRFELPDAAVRPEDFYWAHQCLHSVCICSCWASGTRSYLCALSSFHSALVIKETQVRAYQVNVVTDFVRLV